jgi:hypothetical protein
MPQLRITKHRTAGARRRREPVLPLDPRDPDVIRAKHLQRRRVKPGTLRRSAP